ncbi:hypothetical protein N7533_002140 [Penicillium manginii]|uniref:uncharacterized protein n=1 Tax=Penicillium manginii TaxID=203109 RepID=UPI002548A6A7|nr:uncharacterized protein N7533_002140 [Penicillium manginii]KAJ5763459.1 hypothetical protein N7533_002140 [Penicillium manginii]
MLLAATAIFLYYTAWTLLMPFVDPGHPLHDIFPSARLGHPNPCYPDSPGIGRGRYLHKYRHDQQQQEEGGQGQGRGQEEDLSDAMAS